MSLFDTVRVAFSPVGDSKDSDSSRFGGSRSVGVKDIDLDLSLFGITETIPFDSNPAGDTDVVVSSRPISGNFDASLFIGFTPVPDTFATPEAVSKPINSKSVDMLSVLDIAVVVSLNLNIAATDSDAAS